MAPVCAQQSSSRRSAMRALACLLGVALCGCSPQAARHEERQTALTSAAASKERVRVLREREAPLRSALAPRDQPPWFDASGADPYRIAALPSGSGFVGLLRGSRAVVTLDTALDEQQRVALRETPTALCVGSTNEAWVASRYGAHLVRIALGAGGAMLPSLERELPLAGVADLACADAGIAHVLP